ncbi:hypothetical protein HAX54_034373 [Datura stramonium]|uniref:Uncharacterized protein n=1 Tax=Datura stramonium TaxID=4076 RepID=A0ABS8SE45_DATST|nr:hypothetical protein [Datura stramonium]
MIRKKRNAVQKYLKNDIADLINSGLDVNAYDRTEGLLVELNLLSCYDFLDQYCEQILSHLETIFRQRECPENCREPVGSLIFAAARLADLPELRQLRTMFNERYGNSLECHVNKQFAEKLKLLPHKKDVKLQLMQDTAAEFGIEWNSKALQQMLHEQKDKDVSGKNKKSEDKGSYDAVENATPRQKSVGSKHLDPQSGDKDSGHERHGIKIPNVEVSRQRTRDGLSGRATSLPVELEKRSPEDLMKGHIRVNSCTLDMFGPNGHVHPKVPIYEEVLARMTDLGGKSKE